MEFLMSSEFGRAFFFFGTVLVLLVLYCGYFKNIFSVVLTNTLTVVFIIYVSAFLLYRYLTSHVQAHMAHEPNYIFVAALHGTISMCAIVVAVYAFLKARLSFRGGENYFRLHPRLTLCLALLWPLSLMSGLLF